MLSAAGIISGDAAQEAAPLLDLALGANSDGTKLTIDFKKGKSYIGPLKVADAPTLP